MGDHAHSPLMFEFFSPILPYLSMVSDSWHHLFSCFGNHKHHKSEATSVLFETEYVIVYKYLNAHFLFCDFLHGMKTEIIFCVPHWEIVYYKTREKRWTQASGEREARD